MSKRALVFGAGGQDGSYLAELLLSGGYEVHGTHRRSSVDNLMRVRHLLPNPRLILYRSDLTDVASTQYVLRKVRPHEVYNTADQDHVGWSESCPGYSVAVTAGGVQTILDTMRDPHLSESRFFQPISATVFGGNAPAPQTVDTPLNPDSPYACAKAHAWHLCRYYRRKYGMFVSCGVFYNHDSPRRGPDYLLQKIARGERLTGDLSMPVDVGYAPEYVLAAWRMLQHPEPLDLLIGTGRPYRIKDLVRLAEYPGCDAEPVVVGTGGLTSGTTCLTPDTRPAFEALGWEATLDARDVLLLLLKENRQREGRRGKEPERSQVDGILDATGRVPR